MDAQLTLFFNGSNSLFLNGVAWMLTQASTWILLYLTLAYLLWSNYGFRRFLLIVGILVLGVFCADQLSSTVAKPFFERFRPTHDPQLLHLVDVVRAYRGGSYGFFSSHAANTMVVSTFCTLLFRNRMLSWTLFSWTLLNCWTRLYLGVHFMSDLGVGLLVGAVIAFGCYRLCLRLLRHRPFPPLTFDRQWLLPFIFLFTISLSCIPWRLLF